MPLSLSGDGAITGMVSASSSDLSTALAAKGDLAGETWTGTHDFSGATLSGVPAGLTLLEPSSIAYSGTSASSSGGTTTFATVTSLSLNGVFSATYQNYLALIEVTSSTGNTDLNARLRASGTDATGADYNRQELYSDSGTVAGGELTGQTYLKIHSITNAVSPCSATIVSPNEAANTTVWTQGMRKWDRMVLMGGQHSVSTAYDGLTILPAANSISGRIRVYGYQGA